MVKDNGLRYVEMRNLRVEIYTIGRDSYGESNVLLFFCGEDIEYSIVIDSCDSDIEILREKIISEYGLKYFNMIVWTHPHVDHTKGIETLIREFANSSTKIVCPPKLDILEDCINDESKEVYDLITEISKRNSISNGEYVEASFGSEIENIQYKDKDSDKKFLLNITAIAPMAHRLLNMKNNCKHSKIECNHPLNEYSIVVDVSINNYSFVFTGDVEKETINEVLEKSLTLENVIFLKIPHHGSESSKNMIDLFDIESCRGMICSSTALLKRGKFNLLPNIDVLRKYSEMFNTSVFCTSNSYINKISNESNWGLIGITFKIPKDNTYGEIEREMVLDGDAVEVFEKIIY